MEFQTFSHPLGLTYFTIKMDYPSHTSCIDAMIFVLFGIAGPNWNKRMHISLWMLLLPVCRMKMVYEQRLDISLEFFVVFSPKTSILMYAE